MPATPTAPPSTPVSGTDHTPPFLDSRPILAGAWEGSTWSTRSEASMNDIDADEHRHTLDGEEGHTAPLQPGPLPPRSA
jgi:hypothetical protein